MCLDVSLEGREQVVRYNVFIVESGKEHLLREVLGFVVEFGTHAALERLVLVLDGLEQVLVSCSVIIFFVVNWLKIDYGQVLFAVESQEIDAQDGKIVLGIRVPNSVIDLGVVTGVVISHADLAVFLGRKANIYDASFLLLVLVVGKVRAFFVLAFYYFKVGEILFHEIHLPFPEWHVQELVVDVGVDGGLPGHAVFCFGFTDRKCSLGEFVWRWWLNQRKFLGDASHCST
mmetsp:Transcript_32003/g.75264  ORF Transcript_32003/g.75264 Transcript_32003/m.75264 type:complete len:231 (+) Transcript_32003:426-1118(+)